MRTDDVTYGADYWNSLDGGAGYKDSVMWQDLAFIVKEMFCYDGVSDIGGSIHHLDIGCASGYLSKHLRQRGVDSHGCDLSTWALDHADDWIKPFVHWWDITESQDIPDWSSVGYNLITCFETLEHIPEEHVMDVLQRMYERLDPDGIALFTICTNDRPGWDTDPTHITIYDRDWWEVRLTKTGFTSLDRELSRIRQFHLFADHSGVFVLRR